MNFPGLNFPRYQFRTRMTNGKPQVFDEVRKKWIALTPEEWVRQHAAKWVVQEKNYPASLLAVEKSITVNGLTKRCDIVAFGPDHKPFLVIECKSPEVEITQEVFDQAARYNMTLNVSLVLLTNGLRHFCCRIDHEKQKYIFVKELPVYNPS